LYQFWKALFVFCKTLIISILDCNRPTNPTNGQFECESSSFKEGSACTLICDPGYIPAGKVLMRCWEDKAAMKMDWNVPMSRFQCVKPCHLVVGGMNNKTR
jgi:hypothetical protein